MVMSTPLREGAVKSIDLLFDAITQTPTNTWLVSGFDPEVTVVCAANAHDALKAEADEMRAALVKIARAQVGPHQSVGGEFNRLRSVAEQALPKEMRR
jgi:hypothetical protein